MVKRKRRAQPRRSETAQDRKATKRKMIENATSPSAEKPMVWLGPCHTNSTARGDPDIDPEENSQVEQYFDLANASCVAYQCQQDNYSVNVKQNATIEDSTGGIVWESAYLVSAFLDANRKHWLQTAGTRSVLEVGAGCGLLGLTIAHITAPRKTQVVLTETPPVTDLLIENVEAERLKHIKEQPTGKLRMRNIHIDTFQNRLANRILKLDCFLPCFRRY
jgi:hypothetical protein